MSTATSPPPLSTTTSNTTVSPSSPSRPSRLRGLSYLRNYTHNHLHSRENSNSGSVGSSRPFILRATSYPSPTSTPTANRNNADITPTPQSPSGVISPQATPTAQLPNPQDTEGSGTSGWLPASGGQSATGTNLQAQSISTSTSAAVNGGSTEEAPFSAVMGRTRSATTSRVLDADMADGTQAQFGSVPSSNPPQAAATLPSIRLSQHQDARAPRPSLIFTPMQRTLPTGKETIRVGRYSEREAIPNQSYNVPSSAPIGFKSKVVSRRHCEFWCSEGTWYIKDVKSSSGTFLNHVRLSSPGQESKPFAVKDGDIVQLGIDFKGGEEMIFRCVKIRVELNRNWQNSLNTFNVASHKRLRNMAKQNSSPAGGSSSQDCSICLGAIAPCQALFVAPCSHTWHYKCVRRILNGPIWPQFICPNCRAVADLEAEVDEPYDEGEWEEAEGGTESAAAPVTDIPAPTSDARSSGEDLVLEEEEANRTSRAANDDEVVGASTTDESDEDFATRFPDINNLNLMPATNASQNATSTPMAIPQSRNGSVSARSVSQQQKSDTNRTPSPDSRTRAGPPGTVDLSGVGDTVEGPMTPRNDVGPFIFDGSAGRANAARRVASPASVAAANATTDSLAAVVDSDAEAK